MDRACEGRVAIVTGASRGLGAAIAMRLGEEGARLAVSARTLDEDPKQPGSLADTVRSVEEAGGQAIAIRADLSRPEDRARLVSETEQRLGPVDILVNNAAVTFLIPFDEFPEKRFRLMFELQVRAPFELTQLVLPGMRLRGRGWIVNVTSRAAIHPLGPPFDKIQTDGGFSVYGMCKAALERFTTGLAAEAFADGIAVNAVAPWGVVPTHGASFHDLVGEDAPEGPEWIAEAALLLASCDPAKVTGRIAYSQPLLAEFKQRPRLV
jgi:citronellol/citronellal dehydrogenase